MPVNGMTIKEGATFTPVGGTDITFDDSGEEIANGIVCVNQAEANFFAREKLIAVSRLPVQDKMGKFSKQKTSVRIIDPEVLADGTTVYDVGRFEIETHPEGGATRITKIRRLLLAAANSASLDNLFLVGSIK